MLTNIATPVGGAILTREVARFGTEAVTAMAVIGRLTPLVFAVVFALSGAIGPIIGQNNGAGRPDRVRGAFDAAVLFTAVHVALASALLCVLRAPIADLFEAQGQTRALIYLFCGPLALASFFNGVIFVANASFNNLGHPAWSTAVNWGRHTLGTWPFVVAGAALSTRHGGSGGASVNLSSMGAETGSPGELVHYAAAKGAVESFTRGLAREVATEGIRVNAVSPGLIDTEIHAEAGQRAAAMHTGALAGEDAVRDAALAAAGAVRARTMRKGAELAAALAQGLRMPGRRLGVMTTSGGVGVLAADYAEKAGLTLPPLPGPAAVAITAARARRPDMPIVLSMLAPEGPRQVMTEHGVPVFEDPADAVRLMGLLARIASPAADPASSGDLPPLPWNDQRASA